MPICRAIREVVESVPIDDVMGHVARISSYDRYQASLGLADAAAYVATAARVIGLEAVAIEKYPADGEMRWWTYRAPVSWTPLVARLEIRAGDQTVLLVDHDLQPFSIATYSAPTASDGIVAKIVRYGGLSSSDFAGSIVLIGRDHFNRSGLLNSLERNRALGFITDAACRTVGKEEFTGRIELASGTSLFGFSITTQQLRALTAQTTTGAQASVTIQVDRSALMPVTTAVLPGESSEEIWFTAHLCHPRPGANDNASGVAALLGIAATLIAARRRPERTIRFLWGPEFLGVAATLHGRMGSLPLAALNLDMVGEDQQQCGGPFVVERHPDCVPSVLNALADEVVGSVFTYVNGAGTTWKPAPFTGFSDHSLFADPSIRRPAIQFCHTSDRFNHSAGDSLARVSRHEMHRSVVAGAVLGQILSGDVLTSAEIAGVVQDWCSRERTRAEQIARKHASAGHHDWAADFLRYVERRNCSVIAMLENQEVDRGPVVQEEAPTRSWSGPFNTRAMIADMPPEIRTIVSGLAASDKRVLSLLLNFAIRVDGRRDRKTVLEETSFALERPVTQGLAAQLFDAIVAAGWIRERGSTPKPCAMLELPS